MTETTKHINSTDVESNGLFRWDLNLVSQSSIAYKGPPLTQQQKRVSVLFFLRKARKSLNGCTRTYTHHKLTTGNAARHTSGYSVHCNTSSQKLIFVAEHQGKMNPTGKALLSLWTSNLARGGATIIAALKILRKRKRQSKNGQVQLGSTRCGRVSCWSGT